MHTQVDLCISQGGEGVEMYFGLQMFLSLISFCIFMQESLQFDLPWSLFILPHWGLDLYPIKSPTPHTHAHK